MKKRIRWSIKEKTDIGWTVRKRGLTFSQALKACRRKKNYSRFPESKEYHP